MSAGLAWPCGIAAAGLAGTAIADVIAGQTFGADEAQHLIAVAGAVLLCWQARTVGGPVEPVLAAGRAQLDSLPGEMHPTASAWPEIPPESRGTGTDAARTSGPDIAARGGHDGGHEAVA